MDSGPTVPSKEQSLGATPPAASDQAASATASASPSSAPSLNDPSAGETLLVDPSLPTLDSVRLDDVQVVNPPVDITSIPEGIGYLNSIGLDYGTGPTSMLEWVLEHLHITMGMSWGLSIIVAAAAIRLVLLPLYIKAADSSARTTAFMSLTKPIQNKMAAAQKSKDIAGVQSAWLELQALRKDAGIRLRDPFIPAIAQGVLGFCMYRLTRAAAVLPVPGFKDGGFLWLQDLTATDPYYILPITMGAMIHLLARFGGETGSQSLEHMHRAMRPFLLHVMPGMLALIMSTQPGAVVLYFAVTGVLGAGQGLLFRRPAVREWLGIAPVYVSKEPMVNPLVEWMNSKTNTTPTAPPTPTASTLQWQAPTLKRQTYDSTNGRIIDVEPVKREKKKQRQAATSTGSGNVVQDAKTWWKDTGKQVQEDRRAKAMEKAAEDYERRARAQGR